MNRHDTAKTLVTDILERHPEARSSPLEVLRLVYYSTAHKAKVSRSRIDTTIDTIQEFNAAGTSKTLGRQRGGQPSRKNTANTTPRKTTQTKPHFFERNMHYEQSEENRSCQSIK